MATSNPVPLTVKPTLEEIKRLVSAYRGTPKPTRVPVYGQISSVLITPAAAYLKLREGDGKVCSGDDAGDGNGRASRGMSFLFESASGRDADRYSFIGSEPNRVLTTGPGYGAEEDPLPALEAALRERLVLRVPSELHGSDDGLPPIAGSAVGYVGYDCVRYFEPRTAKPSAAAKDVLRIPESLFMFFDTVVAFDHRWNTIKLVSHVLLDPEVFSSPLSPGSGPDDNSASSAIDAAYATVVRDINALAAKLTASDTPLPHQQPIELAPGGGGGEGSKKITEEMVAEGSNIGRAGYERHVETLKEHIVNGDITQCVPSQRCRRPTALHPFNLYMQLRCVNPSPYLFYVDCGGFQLVGASPELLVKTEEVEPAAEKSRTGASVSEAVDKDKPARKTDGGDDCAHPQQQPTRWRIVSHPIAGTVRRGATAAEDERLAQQLRASEKDRAEHAMLVDLARNDVNRVCAPASVRVDRLMAVEKFSHVQHLVSQVSGILRPECSRFDAFRSVFPAGTVSGSPKVRAMELIAELEKEKRGVYAGAVGYFGYDGVRMSRAQSSITNGNVATGANKTNGTKSEEKEDEATEVVQGTMDTCIALRTMLVKDGVVYLQAGGGIVYDSDPYEEWMETVNKLRGNLACIEGAEKYWAARS